MHIRGDILESIPCIFQSLLQLKTLTGRNVRYAIQYLQDVTNTEIPCRYTHLIKVREVTPVKPQQHGRKENKIWRKRTTE